MCKCLPWLLCVQLCETPTSLRIALPADHDLEPTISVTASRTTLLKTHDESLSKKSKVFKQCVCNLASFRCCMGRAWRWYLSLKLSVKVSDLSINTILCKPDLKTHMTSITHGTALVFRPRCHHMIGKMVRAELRGTYVLLAGFLAEKRSRVIRPLNAIHI